MDHPGGWAKAACVKLTMFEGELIEAVRKLMWIRDQRRRHASQTT